MNTIYYKIIKIYKQTFFYIFLLINIINVTH